MNLVLQEPGKNRLGIKLAGAFIAGILFLNAVENTSLEGKSKSSGPACGITAYLWPMVNVLLIPGWDAGWELATGCSQWDSKDSEGLILSPGTQPGQCMRSSGGTSDSRGG